VGGMQMPHYTPSGYATALADEISFFDQHLNDKLKKYSEITFNLFCHRSKNKIKTALNFLYSKNSDARAYYRLKAFFWNLK
jgi:hypothetical protein